MVSCHFLSGDQREDFLGESNHNAAREGEKTVAALAGIVAGERKADLDDAPAQQDQTYGADQAKDEVRQVVDDRDGIARGKGMNAHARHEGHRQHKGAVDAKAFLDLRRHGEPCGIPALIQFFHCVVPPVI